MEKHSFLDFWENSEYASLSYLTLTCQALMRSQTKITLEKDRNSNHVHEIWTNRTFSDDTIIIKSLDIEKKE